MCYDDYDQNNFDDSTEEYSQQSEIIQEAKDLGLSRGEIKEVLDSGMDYIPMPQTLEVNDQYLNIDINGEVRDFNDHIICKVDPSEVGGIWPDDNRITEGLQNLSNNEFNRTTNSEDNQYNSQSNIGCLGVISIIIIMAIIAVILFI